MWLEPIKARVQHIGCNAVNVTHLCHWDPAKNAAQAMKVDGCFEEVRSKSKSGSPGAAGHEQLRQIASIAVEDLENCSWLRAGIRMVAAHL